MDKQKYSHLYFKENLPEWKRSKDSLIVKHLFRPLSFYSSSFFANHGFGANAVSIISLIVAIIAGLLYSVNSYTANIVGAFVVLFWMLLDCTDGNIARCVKKEAYGEFIDAASGYMLIMLLYSALGIAAYNTSDFSYLNSSWYLFIGCFAAACDCMSRLLFQKFKNSSYGEEIDTEAKKQMEEQSRSKPSRIMKIHDRIEKEIGLNGLFLPALVVCTILKRMDLFISFYALFSAFTLLGTLLILIKKVLDEMRKVK